MNVNEIPLRPGTGQRLSIALGQVTYRLTLKWNTYSSCWVLDIADSIGAPLAAGLAVVTGADILGQLAYLGIAGGLFTVSDDEPDAVPTFENLGVNGRLYFAPTTA